MWDLTQSSQSPSAAPSYFLESHWWSEISSLSKVILVLEKARSCRVPNLGCRGVESAGWFDVLPKKFCRRHDVWMDMLAWWSCQLPVARSCGLLNHPIVPVEECSGLMQNLMQICCSTCSVSLNVTVTRYACHSIAYTAPTD